MFFLIKWLNYVSIKLNNFLCKCQEIDIEVTPLILHHYTEYIFENCPSLNCISLASQPTLKEYTLRTMSEPLKWPFDLNVSENADGLAVWFTYYTKRENPIEIGGRCDLTLDEALFLVKELKRRGYFEYIREHDRSSVSEI